MSFILFVFVCLFARLFFFSYAVTVHLRTKQTLILSRAHSVTQSSTCKWGNLARNTQVQRKDFFFLFLFFVEEEGVKQTFP